MLKGEVWLLCLTLAAPSFSFSALPSVLSSASSQGGAPTANKGPSTEMEALTAAQQGMLHAVSLHILMFTSAPHSALSVVRVSVHVWAVCSAYSAVPVSASISASLYIRYIISA